MPCQVTAWEACETRREALPSLGAPLRRHNASASPSRRCFNYAASPALLRPDRQQRCGGDALAEAVWAPWGLGSTATAALRWLLDPRSHAEPRGTGRGPGVGQRLSSFAVHPMYR